MPGRNCLLGICCPPAAQAAELAAEIQQRIEMSGEKPTAEAVAKLCATYILGSFDLAPKDSLVAFRNAVRDHAREGYVLAGG